MVTGEVDAMVYEASFLRYLAWTELKGAVDVLPVTFEPQTCGIALPPGSALRGPINRVLLETIEQPAWHEVLYHYLGRSLGNCLYPKSTPYETAGMRIVLD